LVTDEMQLDRNQNCKNVSGRSTYVWSMSSTRFRLHIHFADLLPDRRIWEAKNTISRLGGGIGDGWNEAKNKLELETIAPHALSMYGE
jgi:hypothetical protein